MDSYGQPLIFLLLLGVFLFIPKRMSFGTSFIAGVAATGFGWAGFALGLALDDSMLMQSEIVRTLWIAVCTVAGAFAGPILVINGIRGWLSARLKRP